MERTLRKNVRFDPFRDSASVYSPVLEDIAKIDGVISCPSVSIGGMVDGRFFATLQLELEQNLEKKSPSCMDVGRQLRKRLDRYGIHASGVHCHVAGKHADA